VNDQHVSKAVRNDILNGLPEFEPLPDRDNCWSSDPELTDRLPVTDPDGRTAVVWRYAARHTNWFQGIPPTGREVEIRGITVTTETGDMVRCIDWLDLFAQLDYTLYHRQLNDAIDYGALNDGQKPEFPSTDDIP